MALEGNTPSEKCGIEIKGNNKWITLIENSVINGKSRHNPES